MLLLVYMLSVAIGVPALATPAIPAVSINLTGCWVMGASNGKPPPLGCGVAPPDSGDGLLYLHQTSTHTGSSINLVDACLWQSCYRPATGNLINTSNGAGMLRLRTLAGDRRVGNCTAPRFPPDGLLEYFNWILPVGWPLNGNKTRGTNVSASDLSGTFVNDGEIEGLAGTIFLRRSTDPAACNHMRILPDCTAVPTAGDDAPQGGLQPLPSYEASCEAVMEMVCGKMQGAGPACMKCLEIPSHHNSIRQVGCTPPDVKAFCGMKPPRPMPPPAPEPMPPQSSHNVTGCYRFGGSAGQPPGNGCGMAPASSGKGVAFVSHTPNGSIRVCLNQFCSRRLTGNFTTASNGVSFLTLATDLDVGNCTRVVSKNFPEAGLFAHIDFVVPAGWPVSGIKTKGTYTHGNHTITGMFVNNGPALAGMLEMDPNVDPRECDRLHEIPFCTDFVPSTADGAND